MISSTTMKIKESGLHIHSITLKNGKVFDLNKYFNIKVNEILPESNLSNDFQYLPPSRLIRNLSDKIFDKILESNLKEEIPAYTHILKEINDNGIVGLISTDVNIIEEDKRETNFYDKVKNSKENTELKEYKDTRIIGIISPECFTEEFTEYLDEDKENKNYSKIFQEKTLTFDISKLIPNIDPRSRYYKNMMKELKSNDKTPLHNHMKDYENMHSFGYSLVTLRGLNIFEMRSGIKGLLGKKITTEDIFNNCDIVGYDSNLPIHSSRLSYSYSYDNEIKKKNIKYSELLKNIHKDLLEEVKDMKIQNNCIPKNINDYKIRDNQNIYDYMRDNRTDSKIYGIYNELIDITDNKLSIIYDDKEKKDTIRLHIKLNRIDENKIIDVSSNSFQRTFYPQKLKDIINGKTNKHLEGKTEEETKSGTYLFDVKLFKKFMNITEEISLKEMKEKCYNNHYKYPKDDFLRMVKLSKYFNDKSSKISKIKQPGYNLELETIINGKNVKKDINIEYTNLRNIFEDMNDLKSDLRLEIENRIKTELTQDKNQEVKEPSI